MIHAIAIGVAPVGSDPALDLIDQAVTDPGISKRRCHNAEELIAFAKEVCCERGPIDLFDIVDHGGAGLQILSGKILFRASDDRCADLEGKEIAEKLALHLAPMAHVRLLGCNVAAAPPAGFNDSGRHLLWHLGNILGARRIAFAANRSLRPDDYGASGFLRQQELTFMFSSLAAIDGDAPTPGQRDTHLADLVKDFRCRARPTDHW